MKFHVLALAVAAVVAAPAFAAGDQPAGLSVTRTFPANKPATFGPSTEALDATAFFSNVTTFTGSAALNGGAGDDPAAGANTITRLICDDLTYNGAVARNVTGYRFAVANLNAAAVSVRARVRFFQDNGANAPGTLIGGNSFAAFSFTGNQITVLTANPLTTAIPFPGTGPAVKVWACITFDNNSGATGATFAELNNFGMGTYNPPDRGTSADIYFQTTTNGAFFASNPAGATTNLGGAPVANFGWELLDSVTMPVELQSFEVK